MKQAELMGLEGERVDYRKLKNDPRPNLVSKGATDAESDYLFHERSGAGWTGRRVELNEIPAMKLIEMIEATLERHEVRKVVPSPCDLEMYIRHQAIEVAVKARLEPLEAEIRKQIQREAEGLKIPSDIAQQTRKAITGTTTPWDGFCRDYAGKLAANLRK